MEKLPREITFLRHAENVDDPLFLNNELPISQNGYEQSKWAAGVLAKYIEQPDVVFTSPAKRTTETADVVSRSSIRIEDARLSEAGWGSDYAGGSESKGQAKKRIDDFLNEIGERYVGKNILVVAHGGLIKLAEESIEGTLLPKHDIENCSIVHYSTIDKETGNSASYLRFKSTARPFDQDMNGEVVKKGVNVFFVRHGESTSNRDGVLAGGSDFPLTNTGIVQAERVADSLSNLDVVFNKIFSSPLSRSLDTAKTIAEKLKIQEDAIILLDDLAGCGGGSLEGKPYSEWYSVPADELVSVYGAESYTKQRERIGRAILDILDNTNSGDTVMVVSHSSVFQVLQAINNNITNEKETFEQDKPSPAGYINIEM